MSAFLRHVIFIMDDESAKRNIRIRMFHLFVGNIFSVIYVTIVATLVILHVIRGNLNIAEATIDYLMVMGATTCSSSVIFWRSSRPKLIRIFTHLANAADTLENLNEASKKRVEKELSKVRSASKLPFFGLWSFSICIIAGAMFKKYPIRIWLLDSAPHWLRMTVELVFHIQAAGINIPAVCSIVLVVLLASASLFECLNTQLRICKANEEYLTKLVLVHQELLAASIHARALFQNQMLSFGLVWITVILLAFFNIASGCFGVLATAAGPLGICIVVFSCETGDVLVCKSLQTVDAICNSGWENGDRSFRQKTLIILFRAQRPAHLKIPYVGILYRPQLAILRKVYSIFTLMLTMFDETHCGVQ